MDMRDGKIKIWLAKPRRSPFWTIRFVDPETGRTQQKSTGTAKRTDAERNLGEFRADLLNKRYVGPNNVTWAAFRQKYETEVLSGFAQKTVRKVDTVFDAVERLLKPTKLALLSASRISRFVAELREGGRSETTIHGYLAHLRAALSWAVSVGMLAAVPKIHRPRRAKLLKKAKGRGPTTEEFHKMLAVVEKVVGSKKAASWKWFLEGLWWSGLRIGEALDLCWDRDDKLRVDVSGSRPLLFIPAELEKGHKDRLLPLAPEFAEFLLTTPPEKRTGRVFRPGELGDQAKLLSVNRVIKVAGLIGKKAQIVVHVDARTGKAKYASAHDLRRAFGDRWALRVMPPVLMQLMRHESIETTMRYYVGRSVEATADVVWEAFARASGTSEKVNGKKERDTLRDTGKQPAAGNDERTGTTE